MEIRIRMSRSVIDAVQALPMTYHRLPFIITPWLGNWKLPSPASLRHWLPGPEQDMSPNQLGTFNYLLLRYHCSKRSVCSSELRKAVLSVTSQDHQRRIILNHNCCSFSRSCIPLCWKKSHVLIISLFKTRTFIFVFACCSDIRFRLVSSRQLTGERGL